jgi:hypothetical protein
MTEAEWFSCDDPTTMLVFLRERGRASERRLRLFAVGCCRRIWPKITHETGRQVVEVVERFSEGQATEAELVAAWDAAGDDLSAGMRAARASAAAALREGWLVGSVARAAALADGEMTRAASTRVQCDLLRCIFGNPFGLLPPVPSAWLSWNNGTIPRLAEAAYNERQLPAGTLDVARLAVLADALEEAGCHDAGLLGHLWSEGPHVRGCWALDLLLQKG